MSTTDGQNREVIVIAGDHRGILKGDIITAASEPSGTQSSSGHVVNGGALRTFRIESNIRCKIGLCHNQKKD